jgi:chitin disaccharide deacetylase
MRIPAAVLTLAIVAPFAMSPRSATASDPVYDPAAATTVTQVRDPFNDGRIRMIFRLDDAGFCHAANSAIERVLNEGVVTAVSVMVTTPWLDEAVEMLAKHPEVSVGVHTALNSEWLPYRWGPVLPPREVPSLVDEWGKFYGTRKQMMARVPNLDEVEAELRAQVELARRKGLRLSYMDHHMSAAVTTPQMRDRFARVAKDNGLGVSRWFGEAQGPLIYSVEPEKKVDFLVDEIRRIDKPGLYLVVCHVGLDVPEMSVLRDQNTSAPKNMSRHRQAETDALCDPRLKQVIREKNIELVGYDVLRERFLDQMRPPD